jgi:hypothetical protein
MPSDTPSPDMPTTDAVTGLSVDDLAFLAELGAAIDSTDPMPADLVDRSMAAFAMRDLDAELAELVADSWSEDGALVGVRAAAMVEPERLLTFQAASISVDVEVSDERVIGRITPPLGAAFVDAASILGQKTRATVDDRGRFVVDVPAGGPMYRLEFAVLTDDGNRRIVTDWVRR